MGEVTGGEVNNMKTKWIIVFLFVMICAFFVSCGSPATDMNTSRSGTLSTGREFVFYGAGQVDMTLEEFLEKGGFVYFRTENFVIQEETIEEMLERPEMHMGIEHSPLDFVFIYAFYFAESSDVLFWVESFEEIYIWLGFPSALIVNLESGVVYNYTQRIPSWGWWK